MLKNNIFLFLVLLILFACQKIETLDEIVFDYDQFQKITITAKNKKINDLYEPKYSDTYIDYSLSKSPIFYLNNWLQNNINILGRENNLEINIIQASLKKTEVKNNEPEKYKEKTIYLFEMIYLVEFILYSDINSILSTSIVEVKRSITSSKHISIQENEKTIDYLIFKCLDDFSKKSEEVINNHFSKFIL